MDRRPNRRLVVCRWINWEPNFTVNTLANTFCNQTLFLRRSSVFIFTFATFWPTEVPKTRPVREAMQTYITTHSNGRKIQFDFASNDRFPEVPQKSMLTDKEFTYMGNFANRTPGRGSAIQDTSTFRSHSAGGRCCGCDL